MNKDIEINPTQFIVIGFLTVIVIGTLLLSLPISVVDSSPNFIDALFTATSAVCVTGLTVVDTGTHWTVFGQVIIMILIQVGGLGFMTMVTMVGIFLGKKISLKERLLIQTSLNQNQLSGVVRLIKNILIITFIIQAIGAIFLATVFIPEFGVKVGSYYSVFHSISAFCNAGFDLIGDGRGLMPYQDNIIINLTIMSLIVIGGLGFSVYNDVLMKKLDYRKYRLQTKIVFFMTILLILIGFILIFIIEYSNSMEDLGFKNKLMASMFQSITTRTAGFNTIDIAEMHSSSKIVMLFLMFVGGSPGSTAGGIKTVTFAVLLLAIISEIKGQKSIKIFNRSIENTIINRILTILAISLFIIFIAIVLLNILESDMEFMDLTFEAFSAFGTVGITLGVTSELNTLSRLIIILLMFLGRVGPFTMAMALLFKSNKTKDDIKYPTEKVNIG